MPADDPRMRDLSVYAEKVLTLSVSVPVKKDMHRFLELNSKNR
jgi:hypothetical protein